MIRELRWVIVFFTALFCLENIDYIPPPEPQPIVVEASQEDVSQELAERKLWLIQESLAYALHRITKVPGNQAREIVSLVKMEILNYEGIDSVTVLGLIVVESYARTHAISSAGARGLMQIMPETGQFINASFPEEWEGRQMLYDVETNIRYGIWYLNHLQELFPDDEQAILAAYNWGPYNIQWRQRNGHALPKVYPGKIWEAREQIREKVYEYYHAQYWRSLDLSRDPPYFEDYAPKSPPRSRHPELFVHDGESEFLREGSGIQQMSSLFPGRNRSVSR